MEAKRQSTVLSSQIEKAAKSQTAADNYSQLRKIALKEGASLFGIADLKNFKKEISQEVSPLLPALHYGISIGVELSYAVLDTITDKPTLIYSWHYRQINTLLDRIALRISLFIQSHGYLGLPIAASQVVDWTNQKSHFSHRHLGSLAGLGWIGRNNLLVNETFGAGFRLVSILTDMPVITDKPVNADCGRCRECIAVCPAEAIKDKAKDFQYRACFEKLKEFSRLPGIKYYICGVCVKACPASGRPGTRPAAKRDSRHAQDMP